MGCPKNQTGLAELKVGALHAVIDRDVAVASERQIIVQIVSKKASPSIACAKRPHKGEIQIVERIAKTQCAFKFRHRRRDRLFGLRCEKIDRSFVIPIRPLRVGEQPYLTGPN